MIFDPNYNINDIKTKNITNNRRFSRGELSRKIIECIKEKPSTVKEITDYVSIGSNKSSKEIVEYRKNIYSAIRNMEMRNILNSFEIDGIKHYKIS